MSILPRSADQSLSNLGMNSNQALFDTPQLRYLATGSKLRLPNMPDEDISEQPQLLDRNGVVIHGLTAYLLHLRLNGRRIETVKMYARILLDFLRTLADAHGGVGLPWQEVGDNVLAVWKTHLLGPRMVKNTITGNRGVKAQTYNYRLSTILASFLHAEKNGWASGLIGDTSTGDLYKVSISLEGGSVRHDSHVTTVRKAAIQLPTERDFALVDAESGRLRKSRDLQKRDRAIVTLMRKCTLRRSEVTGLLVSDVPSRRRIKIFEEAVRNGAAPLLQIWVNRAKRGGRRLVPMPLSLVSELREHIDGPRAELLRRKGIPPSDWPEEVFLSSKTGGALGPQSITNWIKLAAKAAEKLNPTHIGAVALGSIRPHHNRHSAITDLGIGSLESGKSEQEALLFVMDASGINRLDTASIYLHLGQGLLAAQSAGHRKMATKWNDSAAVLLKREGRASKGRRG